jgi:hypothetical protein
MKYKGGENKEDFGCSDPKNCPCWSEIGYLPHVGVRENWWFATQYHLPFKFNDDWIAASGITYGRTDFHKITSYVYTWITQPNRKNMTSEQKYLFSMPYMALPVNDDFSAEFNKLKSKFEKYILLK